MKNPFIFFLWFLHCTELYASLFPSDLSPLFLFFSAPLFPNNILWPSSSVFFASSTFSPPLPRLPFIYLAFSTSTSPPPPPPRLPLLQPRLPLLASSTSPSPPLPHLPLHLPRILLLYLAFSTSSTSPSPPLPRLHLLYLVYLFLSSTLLLPAPRPCFYHAPYATMSPPAPPSLTCLLLLLLLHLLPHLLSSSTSTSSPPPPPPCLLLLLLLHLVSSFTSFCYYSSIPNVS